MKRNMLFDTVTEKYNDNRPVYVDEMFKMIIEYAGITGNSRLLEIGPGTGQATEPFLKTGAEVTCIEPGRNLTEFCRKRFRHYGNFDIVNCSFEEYIKDDHCYDLIYAGTAFHWIDFKSGMKKAFSLLKDKGGIALFWNRPNVNNPDLPLHMVVQDVYRRVNGQSKHCTKEEFEQKFDHIDDSLIKAGFTDVQRVFFNTERNLSAEEYKELLKTYSDVIALNDEKRTELVESIGQEILKHGNVMHIDDRIDLHIGRK